MQTSSHSKTNNGKTFVLAILLKSMKMSSHLLTSYFWDLVIKKEFATLKLKTLMVKQI
jgi:hypothetical protein